MDTAVDTLIEAFRPLIVFPEGAVFRTNDLCATATRRSGVSGAYSGSQKGNKQDGGQVLIHPVAIKYLYRGDIRQAVTPGDRRDRGAIDLVASPLPLSAGTDQQDIAALLSLKEIEYLGGPQEGSVFERQTGLVDHFARTAGRKVARQSFARSVDTADQSPANEDRAALELKQKLRANSASNSGKI